MNIEYNLKVVIMLLLTLMLGCLIAAGFTYKILTRSFEMYNKKFDYLSEKIDNFGEKYKKSEKLIKTK